MESERRASTEELLAHAGWVRGLSRALVADPHAAADLEQDAWVAALQHPPRPGDGLRAWWSRVVRNEATDAHRARDRRAEREAEARPDVETPTPLETNAALDAQRRLASAIERLEEPLRATVIRRYVQGLSSPEIAKIDGVSESTVRTRLQRALETLRRDLDERTPGGRATWSAMLAPLAARSNEMVGATAVVGIALSTKLSIAAATLLALFGVAFAVGTFDEDDASSTLFASAPIERDEHPEPVAPLDDASRATAAIAEVAPADALAAETTTAEPVATITARFVTAAGRPIAGATLTSLDRAGTGECALDDAPTAISGADGLVALELRTSDRSKRRGMRSGMPPGAWDVVIEVGGRGWAHAEVNPTATIGSTTTLGDVVLHEGADVRGRCLGDDGAPLAATRVELVRPDLSLAERDAIRGGVYWRVGALSVVLTLADGTFAMRGVPVGTFRVNVRPDAHEEVVTDAFDLRAGDDLVLPDLVLRANGRTIRGRVLMPDGTPCLRAELGRTFEEEDGSWIGAGLTKDGSFVISTRTDRPVDLCATAMKFELGEALVLDVPPGTDDVELRLTEPRWIDVLVVDGSGAPVEDYSLGWELAEGGRSSSDRKPRPGGVSRALVRARPWYVDVEAPGHVKQRRGPFTSADAPASLRIEVARIAMVRGVVRRDGEPAPDATVEILALYETPRIRRDALPQRAADADHSASTDASGAFAVGAQLVGRHVVVARFRDGTLLESEILDLRSGLDVDGIMLDTQRTGTLSGRVVTRPGASSEAAQIVLSNGLPQTRTIALSGDGTFDAEGLAPGTWWLRFAPEPRDRPELLPDGETVVDPTLRSFEIGTQLTTHVEVDLRDVEARVVEGRVRIDGRAPSRWTATLTPGGTHDIRPTSGPVAGDGAFRTSSEWVGGHTLSLRSSGTDRRDDRIDASVEIGARTARRDIALETGTLDARGPAIARRELRVELADGATWITTFEFDAEGRALLDGLPRGVARIRAPDNETVLVETMIGTGTTHVDVP